MEPQPLHGAPNLERVHQLQHLPEALPALVLLRLPRGGGVRGGVLANVREYEGGARGPGLELAPAWVQVDGAARGAGVAPPGAASGLRGRKAGRAGACGSGGGNSGRAMRKRTESGKAAQRGKGGAKRPA